MNAAGPQADQLTLGSASEIHGLVGTSLGHTAWHAIEQTQIDAFADATGDQQWIHVDQQRAALGHFGTTIAHGMLTLSLVPLLVTELVEIPSASLVVNCGFDRVRLIQPVHVSARIRAQCSVLAAEDVVGGVRASFAVEVQTEGQGRPACVAVIVLQWMTGPVAN
jgi:acyl dehydratase